MIETPGTGSLALAARLRFTRTCIHWRQHYFARPVPALVYSDGIVTIRPPQLEDLDADLEAKDDKQIDWMWLPGERETWAAMSPGQQRDHDRGHTMIRHLATLRSTRVLVRTPKQGTEPWHLAGVRWLDVERPAGVERWRYLLPDSRAEIG